MKVHITERALKSVAIPAGRPSIKVFDTEVSGFGAQMTKTGAGSYFVSFRDAQGKQCQEKMAVVGDVAAHTARGLARLRLEEVSKSRGEGRAVRRPGGNGSGRTVADFFYDNYVDKIRSEGRKYKTHTSLFANHLQNAIGEKRLDEVTEKDVLELQEALSRKPVAGGRWKTQQSKTLAPNTVARVMILVRHLFNVALQEKVPGLQDNPTRYLKLTKPKEVKGKFLTVEEVKRLIAVIAGKDLDYLDMVTMLLMTGLRRGNVMRLKWSWVDLEQGTIQVPKEEDKAGHGFTKHLSSQAKDLLVRRFAAMKEGQVATDWVFPNPKTSQPYSSRRCLWVTCIKEANLEGLRYHDLRHTFASMMLESGADIVDVQNALAHTHLKTTAVYLHLTLARKRQTADAAAAQMGF